MNASKPRRRIELIAIGASTGGVEVLYTLLDRLPSGLPPIVIVQHMPSWITGRFAENLSRQCAMRVIEVADGSPIERDTIYLAPGDWHLRLRNSGYHLYAMLDQTEKLHKVRPAADHLFNSIAEQPVVRNTVSILLTGMGRDGAEGMLQLRKKGALTIVQDQKSCAVWGMPKAAVEIGAAMRVMSPDQIRQSLQRCATPPTGSSSKAQPRSGKLYSLSQAALIL